MTDNKNPLNIRPGDVLEYTGASWTGSFQGKQVYGLGGEPVA